jgi:hypothetical protein
MRTGCAIPTMWPGDDLTFEAGAPTAASGEPFDAARAVCSCLAAANDDSDGSQASSSAERALPQ